MATQKPISTISYNSEAFLFEKLSNLISSHTIQSYMYIFHKGEDGDKDHFHLRIEPNKRVDPMDIAALFNEYVFDSIKPLGVRPFRPSKEEDWILYAVHDHDYLSLKYGGPDKGEKLPYSWTDIKAPDFFDVEIAFIRAKASLNHSSVSLAKRLRSGDNAYSLVMQGENVHLVNAVVRALRSTDYERLANENFRLNEELALYREYLDLIGHSNLFHEFMQNT